MVLKSKLYILQIEMSAAKFPVKTFSRVARESHN